MIDINLIREQYNFVKENYEKRKDPELLQRLAQVKEYDEEWRKAQYKLQDIKAKKNELSKSVNVAKKEGKDIKPILEGVKRLKEELTNSEMICEDMRLRALNGMKHLPNLLHESVPYGADDRDNDMVRAWGENDAGAAIPNGVFLEEAGLADFGRSAKISGAGFYFLQGDMVRLHLALLTFAMDHMCTKRYKPIEPPLMMRREAYEGVTDLADFEDMLYKIEGEDLYLVATSEAPLTAMHMDEVFSEEELPIKYVGWSPCFRKEVGSHGIEEKGLFRIHQFWKIEQIVFSTPEDSWKMHEELIKNAEELFQLLEIPHRVVTICTGDIGTVAAKKYDIEAWMPSAGEYKEVVSCSNCTEYQSRRLNIKYGAQGGKKEYVHTLNSTAIASSRAMVAIVENYQQADGSLKVPKVLQPYMGNQQVIHPQKS